MYGWDARQNAYTMHWFDSMGGDPGAPARGRWEADTLLFEKQSPMEHSRYEYRFERDGRYTFTISMSQDGKTWTRWHESTWTRA